jgi:beta-glucosidase/6-phospho-beta-glucosidase/beta-galactosidase
VIDHGQLEWAEHYNQRFGLVHVDYETQRRTLKDSAGWYWDFIASNGANPRVKLAATEERR